MDIYIYIYIEALYGDTIYVYMYPPRSTLAKNFRVAIWGGGVPLAYLSGDYPEG